MDGCRVRNFFLGERYDSFAVFLSMKTQAHCAGDDLFGHFKVTEKTSASIVFLLDVDENLIPGGVLETKAQLSQSSATVDFELKAVFFEPSDKQMPRFVKTCITWLHQQYTKLLVETAIGACVQH